VDQPFEVVVRGERQAPGSVTVTRGEARNLPGSFGDPLRAIEMQPGVVPIVSGVPSFFIRGAPPANVGFFIDGVDVPLLYHAFLGPSVIHPGLIDSVDLYRGASPVEYGRFAGPIVAANMRPFDRRFSGEGNLRVIDVGGLAEVPFGECEPGAPPGCSKGSVRASGRYSYTGVVLSLLSNADLRYWDYQAQTSYTLGPHDTVSVFRSRRLFRRIARPSRTKGARFPFTVSTSAGIASFLRAQTFASPSPVVSIAPVGPRTPRVRCPIRRFGSACRAARRSARE
jgi:hypothetical protein